VIEYQEDVAVESQMLRIVIDVVQNKNGTWAAKATAQNQIAELTCKEAISVAEAWHYANKRDLVSVLVSRLMSQLLEG